MKTAFVPSKYLAPLRRLFRTKGQQWINVISKLEGDEKFSGPLWELMKLAFRVNTSRIKDKDIRKEMRRLNLLLKGTPDSELRKEFNYIIRNYRSDMVEMTADKLRDYLSQKISGAIGMLKSQGKKDEKSIKDFSNAKKSLLKNEVLRNVFIVMEWLRRDPTLPKKG
jgi:hypothetical protein